MFSPAGQALLHGGRRCTYWGRSVRQLPVLLARLVPTSSVIANGFSISELLVDQVEALDVAVGARLELVDDVLARPLAEQVRVAPLELQVLLDGHTVTNLVRPGDLPVLGLEDREHPALHGQPSNLHRIA